MPSLPASPRLPHDATRLVASLILLVFTFTTPARAADPVWFDTVQPALVTDADLRALADYAWATLRGEPAKFPETRAADTDRSIVFISIAGENIRAKTQLGAGRGIKAAMDDALRWLPRDPFVNLRVDVVDDCSPMPPVIQNILPGFDRTRHGLALGRDEPLALLPAQILGNRLVDEKRNLQIERIAAFLERDDITADTFKKVRGFRFTVASVYRNANETVTLVAGHRPFAPGTPDDYRQAARDGAEYLARGVGDDGLFAYRYNADLDTLVDDYNILRHAGATWAMLAACERENLPHVIKAAEKAIDAMKARVVPYELDGKTYDVLPDDGNVSLGANALLALVCAQHVITTGDRTYLALGQRAAALLPAIQDTTGRFIIHRTPLIGELDSGYHSPFYPGEAILGLMTLYNVDHDQRWLDCAAANARYLINVRDAQPVRMLPDHWLLHGLRLLQPVKPDSDYPLHSLRLAQVCMANQHIAPHIPDWRGGYYDPPGSTVAACRAEGLASGAITLQDIDAPIIDRVRAAACLAADFALRCQIHPEQAMFMPNPARARGGVMARLDHPEIQIDHNQHAIIGWLLASDIAPQ